MTCQTVTSELTACSLNIFFGNRQSLRGSLHQLYCNGGSGGGGGGGGFFLACEDFRRLFDNSVPTCAFLFIYLSVEIRSHVTNSTFQPRISPQWLSELRRLWPSVP